MYLAYACENNYAFSPATGALIWHHAPACSGGGGYTSTIYQGLVWARDFGGCYCAGIIEDGRTGTQVGTFTTSKAVAFSGSMIYGFNGNEVDARDISSLQDGKWAFVGDGYLNTAPIAVSGHVFVGSRNGNLYELRASDGVVEWSTAVGVGISATNESNETQRAGLVDVEA